MFPPSPVGVWRSGVEAWALPNRLDYEGGAAGEIRDHALGRLKNFEDLMKCANCPV